MLKALMLIFEPVTAWDKIVRAQRSVLFIITVFLLPLLTLTSLAEGYGLTRWGRERSFVTKQKIYSPAEALLFEIAQILLTFVVIVVSARIIKALGETFHGRNSFTQAFTATAYGLSPLFTLRLLDTFPAINPWVGYGIGIVLSVTILYQGLPRVMMPDPPHAFGLYFMSAVMLMLITGLFRFVTTWYLKGEFEDLEKITSDLAARLPF